MDWRSFVRLRDVLRGAGAGGPANQRTDHDHVRSQPPATRRRKEAVSAFSFAGRKREIDTLKQMTVLEVGRLLISHANDIVADAAGLYSSLIRVSQFTKPA